MGKKVLLCADETHVLRAAGTRLRRAGYDVRCAIDGEDAWGKIVENLPDVLITDVKMPHADGFELVRRVRGNPDVMHLPILVLTANGFGSLPEELVGKWRVVAVLSKPFSPRELLRYVDDVLASGAAVPSIQPPPKYA